MIDGSLDAARMLIKGGANVNARLKGPILKRVYDAGDNRLGEGATPFMRAARKCDVEMMQILLDAKADVTLTQKSGNTPIMLCAGAVAGGNSEDTPERVSEPEALPAIQLAIDAGVDVNAANATGDTALHTAATTGGGLPLRHPPAGREWRHGSTPRTRPTAHRSTPPLARVNRTRRPSRCSRSWRAERSLICRSSIKNDWRCRRAVPAASVGRESLGLGGSPRAGLVLEDRRLVAENRIDDRP